jgi:hypothetical protein
MYDPLIVDALVGLDSQVRRTESPVDGHVDMRRQLRVSDTPVEAAEARQPSPPAFASSPATDSDLASFLGGVESGGGGGTVGDVLVVSTRVVQQIAPEATGAWFIPDAAGGQLDATLPFGTGAALLAGRSINMGEKLTGWVAVHRQVILNSDAALDLGEDVHTAAPPLARCVSVPVADGEALAGVLTLYAVDSQPFSEEQSQRLQRVAPYVARAIGQAGVRHRDAVGAGARRAIRN